MQQRQALAEVLDVAPAALGNLSHAYNPDYGTLDTRDNSVGSTAPEVIVCQILAATGRVTIADLPVQVPAPGSRSRCRRRRRASAPGCCPVTRTRSAARTTPTATASPTCRNC